MNCKVCRLCGVEKNVGFDLFGPEAIRTGLLSKIIAQFPKEVIQISPSDNLTKFICHDCELTVNHFAEFCEMVKKVQENFAIKCSSHLFTDLETEKSLECQTNVKTIIVSVGADNKIRCEICLQNLEIVQWMSHWHVVTQGLGSIFCSCRECGHQDDVNNFIKENSVLCPSCFFACAKSLTSCSNKETVQENKKVYTCEVCSKSFRSLGHKNRHKMIHDGLKPFLCETCGVGFNQKVSLKKHLLTHTDSCPHQCEWCGQAFRHKVSLQSHIVSVHSTLTKSFECDQCKKLFATSHKLDRHYRSHTGDQPYRCTICNKSFSQTGNLKTHMKKHKTSTEFSDIDTTNHLLDSPTQKILGTMFDQDASSIHHRENKEFIPLRSHIQDHMHFPSNENPLRKESVQDVFSNFDPHDCDIYNSIT